MDPVTAIFILVVFKRSDLVSLTLSILDERWDGGNLLEGEVSKDSAYT